MGTLGGNMVSSKGIKLFVDGLLKTAMDADAKGNVHTFPSLDFENNMLDDDSCNYISNLLKINNSITTIHLENNKITEKGIKKLCNTIFLPCCAGITDLFLTGNTLSNESITDIMTLFEDESRKIRVQLSHNPIIDLNSFKKIMSSRVLLQIPILQLMRSEHDNSFIK